MICPGGISIYLCTLIDKCCGHPCTPAFVDHLLLITIPLHPQSIPNRILSSHNPQRQRSPDAEEHKERPLPPKGVDGDTEDEPVRQLGVSEEVEGSGRRTAFDELGHVDPFLHPEFLWPCERVDEEHEEQARIDSNVILEVFGVSLSSLAAVPQAQPEEKACSMNFLTYIAHGANGVDICTIIG